MECDVAVNDTIQTIQYISTCNQLSCRQVEVLLFLMMGTNKNVKCIQIINTSKMERQIVPQFFDSARNSPYELFREWSISIKNRLNGLWEELGFD